VGQLAELGKLLWIDVAHAEALNIGCSTSTLAGQCGL
jgi:hypothetical protein